MQREVCGPSHGGDAAGGHYVGDRDHHRSCGPDTGLSEQCFLACVAVDHGHAAIAQLTRSARVELKDHVAHAQRVQGASHIAPVHPVADEDDMVGEGFLVLPLGLSPQGLSDPPPHPLEGTPTPGGTSPEPDQKRRHGHAEHRDADKALVGPLTEHPRALTDLCQDEGELPDLRQREPRRRGAASSEAKQ